MLQTREDIKARVLADKDEILKLDYPYDLANEYAESDTPVWHDDILMTWRFLPRDDKDSHLDTGLEGQTIFTLMAIDIENYYQSLYYSAIEELVEQQEQATV